MRLVSRKRPLATLGVLRGARTMLDPDVPLRATIVGEGPQRRLMERYLRTRGLDWVELPGRVGKEELRRLHQGADVYLTSARLEAFGIAPLEARAAGVPVVAPRGTGVDDFVEDGVDGLLGRQRRGARGRAGPPGRRRRPAGSDPRSPAGHPTGAGLERRARRDPGRVPPGGGARRVITVVGSHDGRAVTSFVLEHGEDPTVGLAARGWPGVGRGGGGCARRPHPAVRRAAGRTGRPAARARGAGAHRGRAGRGRPAPAGRGVRRRGGRGRSCC